MLIFEEEEKNNRTITAQYNTNGLTKKNKNKQPRTKRNPRVKRFICPKEQKYLKARKKHKSYKHKRVRRWFLLINYVSVLAHFLTVIIVCWGG